MLSFLCNKILSLSGVVMEKYLINPNQRIATISKDIYGLSLIHI